MQEKNISDSRATPWTLYFFDGAGWALVEAFDSEEYARAGMNDLLARSEVPADHYALIGPEDKVMPPVPASFGR